MPYATCISPLAVDRTPKDAEMSMPQCRQVLPCLYVQPAIRPAELLNPQTSPAVRRSLPLVVPARLRRRRGRARCRTAVRFPPPWTKYGSRGKSSEAEAQNRSGNGLECIRINRAATVAGPWSAPHGELVIRSCELRDSADKSPPAGNTRVG